MRMSQIPPQISCPACCASAFFLKVVYPQIKGNDGLGYLGLKCQSCKTSFCITKDSTPFSHSEDECVPPSEDGWRYKVTVDRKVIQLEQRLLARYLPRRGKALEIGFGDAIDIYLTQEEGWDTYGIEISPTAVKLATARGLQVFRAWSNELPFKNGTFEFVRLRAVMEHIPTPEITLKEVRRVLTPGGVVRIDCPTEGWSSTVHEGFWRALKRRPINPTLKEVRPTPQLEGPTTWLDPPDHIIWLSQRGMCSLFKRVGLTPLFIRGTYRGDPSHFPWTPRTVYETHNPKPNWKGRLEYRLLYLLDRFSALFSQGSWLYVYGRKTIG